ncbi:hypothetical protein GVAV_002735 [Gurleya vavrai]
MTVCIELLKKNLIFLYTVDKIFEIIKVLFLKKNINKENPEVKNCISEAIKLYEYILIFNKFRKTFINELSVNLMNRIDININKNKKKHQIYYYKETIHSFTAGFYKKVEIIILNIQNFLEIAPVEIFDSNLIFQLKNIKKHEISQKNIDKIKNWINFQQKAFFKSCQIIYDTFQSYNVERQHLALDYVKHSKRVLNYIKFKNLTGYFLNLQLNIENLNRNIKKFLILQKIKLVPILTFLK